MAMVSTALLTLRPLVLEESKCLLVETWLSAWPNPLALFQEMENYSATWQCHWRSSDTSCLIPTEETQNEDSALGACVTPMTASLRG